METNVAQKIETFFEKYPLRHFSKGQIITFANEPPQYITYLIKGQVRQYDVTPSGNEVVVNVFKPPAFFPMSWAINKTPNTYFFEAATIIDVRQAPPEDVVNFLKTNSDVLFNLLSRVYKGTDGLLQRLAYIMGNSARTRLLFELLIECSRFGKPQADGSCLITISETELGTRTGMSRETISREISTLSHVISVSRKGIVVKNPEALQKLLNEANVL